MNAASAKGIFARKGRATVSRGLRRKGCALV